MTIRRVVWWVVFIALVVGVVWVLTDDRNGVLILDRQELEAAGRQQQVPPPQTREFVVTAKDGPLTVMLVSNEQLTALQSNIDHLWRELHAWEWTVAGCGIGVIGLLWAVFALSYRLRDAESRDDEIERSVFAAIQALNVSLQAQLDHKADRYAILRPDLGCKVHDEEPTP